MDPTIFATFLLHPLKRIKSNLHMDSTYRIAIYGKSKDVFIIILPGLDLSILHGKLT